MGWGHKVLWGMASGLRVSLSSSSSNVHGCACLQPGWRDVLACFFPPVTLDGSLGALYQTELNSQYNQNEGSSRQDTGEGV